MSSRYLSSATSATTATSNQAISQSNPNILSGLENQLSGAGKAIEQTISISAITSIVVGGAITAVVWFFINRYLSEKYPIKETQGKRR